MATSTAQKKAYPPGSLSASQVGSIWIQAGGAKSLTPLMVGIAQAESGWHSDACNYDPSRGGPPAGAGQYGGPINTNSQGALAEGLWQINVTGNPDLQVNGVYAKDANLFDPITNAYYAAALARPDGSGIGSNWSETLAAGLAYSKANVFGGGNFLDTNVLNPAGNLVTNAVSGATSAASEVGGGALNALGLSGVGKDIFYGAIILGSGLLMLAGIVLVGADLGLSAFNSTKKAPIVNVVVSRVQARNTNRTQNQPLSQQSRRTKKRAGFKLAADEKPKRGQPGSDKLAAGDSIPY